jgi:transcriptional regulator with XRE-family HTH domain
VAKKRKAPIIFGRVIKILRILSGLNQKQLAELIGYDIYYLNKVETGAVLTSATLADKAYRYFINQGISDEIIMALSEAVKKIG